MLLRSGVSYPSVHWFALVVAFCAGAGTSRSQEIVFQEAVYQVTSEHQLFGPIGGDIFESKTFTGMRPQVRIPSVLQNSATSPDSTWKLRGFRKATTVAGTPGYTRTDPTSGAIVRTLPTGPSAEVDGSLLINQDFELFQGQAITGYIGTSAYAYYTVRLEQISPPPQPVESVPVPMRAMLKVGVATSSGIDDGFAIAVAELVLQGTGVNCPEDRCEFTALHNSQDPTTFAFTRVISETLDLRPNGVISVEIRATGRAELQGLDDGSAGYNAVADPVFEIDLSFEFRDYFRLVISPNIESPPGLSSTGLHEGGFVYDFAFTQNSDELVYSAMFDPASGFIRLYSVATGPGNISSPINGDFLAFGGQLRSFSVAPTGESVLYLADQQVAGRNELYHISMAAPAGERTAVRLNGDLPPGASDVNEYVVSDEGSRVLYVADQDTLFVNELYSVPIEGGDSTRLHTPLASGQQVLFGFRSTPQADRAVYRVQQNVNVIDLYSTPIDGGIPVQLNTPLKPEQNVRKVASFVISPEGDHVVYVANEDDPRSNELYSVPTTGGAVVKLNGPMVNDGDVEQVQITPDGMHAVYAADQDSFDKVELYGVAVGGGDPRKLSGPIAPISGKVKSFAISPDSDRVVYLADAESSRRWELYSTSVSQENAVKLNAPLAFGNVVERFQLSPTGDRVVYTAGEGEDNAIELFAVDIEGGAAMQLSDAASQLGSVGEFQIASTGTYVVYAQDVGSSNLPNALFAVALDAGQPIQITPAFVEGGHIYDFSISPDGSTVGYLADQSIVGTVELYSLPLPSVPEPGDINLDGAVNRTDAALFAQYFGTDVDSTWSTGDFDDDGATTLADLALLQAHQGQSVAALPSATAVPEPSSLVLITCGIVAAAATSRRSTRRHATKRRVVRISCPPLPQILAAVRLTSNGVASYGDPVAFVGGVSWVQFGANSAAGRRV